MFKPIIGITMGDPAGIGPEIIFKALQRPLIYSICRPLIFGTGRFLKNTEEILNPIGVQLMKKMN